ncbi:MAG: TonB-dependent receptor, partial [Maribacter sp.]
MRSIFFLLFLLFSISAVAQKDVQYTNTPLSDVLTELESLYDIKFSYNASFIKEKQLSLQIKNASLVKVLDEIAQELNLVFEKIDERYYTLKAKRALTICGYLIDGLDNAPIEGATITNASQNIGSISDSLGYFSLKKVSLSDTLSISFLGYKTLSIPASKFQEQQCSQYILTASSYLLNEVVVQEYLASGILKTQDGSIKINPKNLDILSGLSEPDILQNIQLLPGIESPTETASGLFIRGGSPDQNLILWDGIKMYNSDHFFGMISAFNPYIISDVNVSRSGTKAEYGDRVSGVIDIKTDNTIPSKTEGGAGLNMTHLDAYLKIPLSQNIGVLVSGRRSITDLLQTPAFNNLSNQVFQNSSISEDQIFFDPDFSESNELFYFNDLTLKLMANLSEKDRFEISSLITKNKLDYTFQDLQFAIGSSDQLNIQNFGANASWKRTWNDNFSTITQVYYSDYDFNYAGEDIYPDENIRTTKSNTIKELGASLHTDWKINENFTFSNGYQFFSNDVTYLIQEDEYAESDDQKSPTHGLYSQLNFTKNQQWYFDIGVRGNYYATHSAVFIEPRIYVERIFGEHFRLKASAEIKNQAVSQIIEFATQDFGIENQVWALSSEDGSPILKSNQFSAGFLFTKKGWNLDLDAYYKNINGLTSITRGFESAEDNFSDGTSITTGIDILLKKRFNNYSTFIGYTYSVTDFLFDDLNQGEAFRGNNDITHSLTWSHAYKWNNFQFSLGWKFRSGIPFSQASGFVDNEDETFVDYEDINAESLPSYHRADFSALYQFQLSKKNTSLKGKLGFSLLNVYGRQNQLSKT